jgi:hypothetical protein
MKKIIFLLLIIGLLLTGCTLDVIEDVFEDKEEVHNITTNSDEIFNDDNDLIEPPVMPS